MYFPFIVLVAVLRRDKEQIDSFRFDAMQINETIWAQIYDFDISGSSPNMEQFIWLRQRSYTIQYMHNP